jgi:hypothetical protein
MLSIVTLNVIMLNVANNPFMLSVIILSFVAPYLNPWYSHLVSFSLLATSILV